MTEFFDKISEVLDSDPKEEKIHTLESLVDAKDPKIINKMISKLDDSEIEVRGEAFSSLVLNENKISEFLIDNLASDNKNLRGFSALILANRKDSDSIPKIIPLTKDSSSMVRACALGALGFLKASDALREIHSCFLDPNVEVKKSALQAALDIEKNVPPEEIKKISKDSDPELEKLLLKAMKK